MDEDQSKRPFFLIVIDEDRGVFFVEGPMADDRPWPARARSATSDSLRPDPGRSGVARCSAQLQSKQTNLGSLE
jgi:hypothetical protein